MPYVVRKRGKGRWVKLDKRGRVVSRHRSRKKALASVRAYYYHKSRRRRRRRKK